MCAESVDLPDGHHVDVLRVDPSVPPRDENGTVMVAASLVDVGDQPWPYGEESVANADPVEAGQRSGRSRLTLTPYHELGQPRAVDDARVDPGHDHT